MLSAMPTKIQIASPCSANWERMAGDDRVRHCPQCNLDVYNFSAMTSVEIDRIVSHREGRVCARFYQRADGMMLTQDCPVGVRAMLRRASRAAAALFAALVSVGPTMAQCAPKGFGNQLTQIQENRPYSLNLIIEDPTSARIPLAHVTLVNTASGKTVEADTDSSGHLSLSEVSPGNYDLSVTSIGFATKHELVSVPQTTNMTLKLEVASLMGEIVEVPRYRVPIISRVLAGLRRIV
jgi:uncharacterized membrane protein